MMEATMTDEERRAIEWDCTRLISLYANRTDRRAWEEVAALYTEDGLMARPTAPDDPIIGRQALLTAFRARPPRVTRHVCADIVVTVESARAASAESVVLIFTGEPDPAGGLPSRDAGPPMVGEFHDRLVLTNEGWRFSERRGRLSFSLG